MTSNARQIWEEVKENIRKLEACPQHLFSGGMPVLGGKCVCLKCVGSMSNVDVKHYIEGWAAAGRDPNEIWPNWTGRHEKANPANS
jgi:hypothetical protein